VPLKNAGNSGFSNGGPVGEQSMYLADRWTDYELLDAGNGEKLERWGDVVLQRPDPQAIWPRGPWQTPHAVYHRSATGGGYWEKKKPLPERWTIEYPGLAGPLTFIIEPTGFKHTGLFPEQAANWDYCSVKIRHAVREGRSPRILNLFGYTAARRLPVRQRARLKSSMSTRPRA
jgi:23S rRNA (cytosine1962-C5)-methyltransferase